MAAIGSSKVAFKALLDDKSAKARVLEFPKGHCWSSAIGFLQDGERSIFVKDRDDEESMLQEAISLVGQEFSKSFTTIDPVVAACYSIERPDLEDLVQDSPAHVLWNLKEQKWKQEDARVDALRERKRSEEKKKEDMDDEASVEDEKKPAPSDHDCWQLEEAATYCLGEDIEGAEESVDHSLRTKLRKAAKRTGTGCLDLFTALLNTSCAQDTVKNDPEWKDYKAYGLLENPDDALTGAETHLLFNEKLKGVGFEAALLFTAAMTLPDVNVENVAIQEICEGSSWHLRLLHFDTGVLPVNAGVSLESLKLVTESPVEFDFLGDQKECTGYFFPVLLSLPAVNEPLSAAALEGLQNVDTEALKIILSEKLSNADVFEEGLNGLGEVVQKRVDSMKAFAAAHPTSSLRDILFHTVAAWKRDWPKYEAESESAEWINEILEWAAKKETKRKR
jgi:hypothetical protein